MLLNAIFRESIEDLALCHNVHDCTDSCLLVEQRVNDWLDNLQKDTGRAATVKGCQSDWPAVSLEGNELVLSNDSKQGNG